MEKVFEKDRTGLLPNVVSIANADMMQTIHVEKINGDESSGAIMSFV